MSSTTDQTHNQVSGISRSREKDIAILTPPWVVVVLFLQLISSLAVIAWVNHDKAQININLNRMGEKVDSVTQARQASEDSQVKSLSEIGLTMKSFDVAAARLGRQISSVANVVDKQINATGTQQIALIDLAASVSTQEAAFETLKSTTLPAMQGLLRDTSQSVVKLNLQLIGQKQSLDNLKSQQTKSNEELVALIKKQSDKIEALEKQVKILQKQRTSSIVTFPDKKTAVN